MVLEKWKEERVLLNMNIQYSCIHAFIYGTRRPEKTATIVFGHK